MAARAGSRGAGGFGVVECSRSAGGKEASAGKEAPRGVASVGEKEGATGASAGASASVSMAKSDSEPSSLGREGVVRSRTLRFLRFLVERDPATGDGLERDLGVWATNVRAWASRQSCSSWERIFRLWRYWSSSRRASSSRRFFAAARLESTSAWRVAVWEAMMRSALNE